MPEHPLVREAQAIAREFARKSLLPRARELESGALPLVAPLRELADRLGLPELAREAAQDPAANDGLLATPHITSALLYELTRVLPGFALSFGASLGLCG